MKLIVLCDNNTFIDNYLLGEPALSFYLENNNDRILFDLGYSSVYKTNAKKLNIDLSKVNKILFSHGHNDHTRGIKYFNFNCKPSVYYCDTCFDYKEYEGEHIGSPYNEKKMNRLFNLNKIHTPTEISKNLYYLGPIPRTHQPDLREEIDDSALVYIGENGLSIITGCSHSGIINICEYAKSHFNRNIYSIIGGLHLLNVDDNSTKIIEYFKNEKINKFYPCHCTSLSVKCQMAQAGLKLFEVASGLTLEIK